jgi:diaminohydroxyphosphoribosylaminopyrimidine deaminase/5-amino-6-(5-phosphoribosylamino)uracil reductase
MRWSWRQASLTPGRSPSCWRIKKASTRAEVLRLPRVDAGLDLDLLLKALSERGVRAILLEGGPTLAGSFLAAGLIDQVVAYITPVLIGGGGRPALAGPGALNIADAKRFQLDDVVRIGLDVRLTATPLK